jgi:phosphopantetheinyl transferase (holo-ACP synthase)
MCSAGNDIISLAEIDVHRTRTKQFYSKILSVAEIENYYKSFSLIVAFEHYVWLLWAMKEAAYKFLKRINTDLIFTPVKFQIKELNVSKKHANQRFDKTQINNDLAGNVLFKAVVENEDEKIYAEAEIFDELIFSVVSEDQDFCNIYCGLCKISDSSHNYQSLAVRNLLVSAVIEELGYGPLNITNDIYGIPFLFYEGKQLSIPISISHHGLYVSYSFKYTCESPFVQKR